MKATVEWIKDMTYLGQSETGHSVVFDGDSANSSAPSPMEMVLMSVGSCASIDVVMILEKSKQQVSGCKVNLSSERAENPPRVFERIHLEFEVTGTNLNEKHVARAVDLSAEKYCSVKLMLDKAATVSHSYKIIDQN
ncbi:OsmC family protein [Flocculibacter collagenilyticus]|uniref:OsmC family protein n=1 Tax=Flocculibacter collagenilyticus TaxID=2744479 RepID=UPI0018F6516C|nr:OsmC family protein [Flocculibacter collagenilyticus]